MAALLPSLGEAHRAFSDNRARYIAQSLATRGGRVAQIDVGRDRALIPVRQPAGADLSPGDAPPLASGRLSFASQGGA